MADDPALFLDLAVRKGLLSRAQVDRSRQSADPRAWLVQNRMMSEDEARDLGQVAEQLEKDAESVHALAKKGVLRPEDARKLQERQLDSAASGKWLSIHDAARDLKIDLDRRREESSHAMPSKLGPYEIVRRIGYGGMGVVYAARDTRLGRDVAIKVLKGLFDEDDVERFRREEQALAKLQHPGIVHIFDVGEENQLPYFVMELLDGVNLLDALDKRTIDRTAAVDVVRQAAEAVAFAHQKGVLHRDLKPANILVTGGKQARVMDFGLAKVQEEAKKAVSVQGVALGTPAYMSPEQARGEVKTVDVRTDVWGLGATLYHVLTGEPPFDGKAVPETLQKVLTKDPIRPRYTDPDVPEDVETICLKALEKDPKRRYQSARDFADDLRRWAAGEPIVAKPPTVGYELRRWIVRKRVIAAAGALALLCAGAGAWGMTWFAKQRSFGKTKADAQKAHRAQDWSRALYESERGLELRYDAELDAIAKECRARRAAEEESRIRQEKLRILDGLIRDARPYFYVRGTDMRPRLAAVEVALADAESAAGRDEEAWAAIGAGWYLVSDPRRAAASLRRSGVHGRRLLARIELERALLEGKPAESADLDGAYLALAEGRTAEALRLGDEGFARLAGEMGAEEFLLIRAWAMSGEARAKEATRALTKRPHWPLALVVRATAEPADAAIRDLDEAIRLAPAMAEAYSLRAKFRRARGDETGAREDEARGQ